MTGYLLSTLLFYGKPTLRVLLACPRKHGPAVICMSRTSAGGAGWSVGSPSEWIALESGRRWLDVGCGTGALSSVVLSVGCRDRPEPGCS